MDSLGNSSKKFFDGLSGIEQNDQDCLQRSLYRFCETGSKEDAFCVYFCYCEIFKIFGFGYDTMGKLVEFLFDHEYHSGGLADKHRDHYSHSVYVFALGLAEYANDESYKDAFHKFYRRENFTAKDFLYHWGMTALFHDIGYPFQLAHEQIKAYTGSLWADKKTHPFVGYQNMAALLALGEETSQGTCYPLSENTVGELLSHNIHARLGYPLKDVQELLEERYCNQPNFMDHGYFSALLLAKQLKDTRTPLTEPLADVLSAIALHNNLNRYDINKKVGETAIPVKKHPLAYLLVLCDELQNWDRKAFGKVSKKDPLAWGILMDIGKDKINVAYLFHSKTVKMPRIVADDKGSRIFEDSRPNQNLLKIEGKEFANFKNNDFQVKEAKSFAAEISELIDSDVTLKAVAKEENRASKAPHFASSDKFVNLCDFARAIHLSYQESERIQHNRKVKNFDELSLEFKLSNIEQAKSYAHKLELINCFYSDEEMEYPVVNGFVEKDSEEKAEALRRDLGFLAREEHLRWVKEKLNAGWTYGTSYIYEDKNGNRIEDFKMRDEKKIHKDLLPYDCLPDSEKEKDRIMIRNMVPFLYEHGHGVRIYSYRDGRKPVLNVAGCGHRSINMNNESLKAQIKAKLLEYSKDYRVVVRTNFAFGADQLISQCANELGLTIKATLPMPYEEYIRKIREDAKEYGYKFDEQDVLNMRHLLAQTVSCKVVPDPVFTYFEASKYIINKCDRLIALWDGVETRLEDDDKNPINRGGTYDNIRLARESRKLNDDEIYIIKCIR